MTERGVQSVVSMSLAVPTFPKEVGNRLRKKLSKKFTELFVSSFPPRRIGRENRFATRAPAAPSFSNPDSARSRVGA
jgi:hypothetical protein